MPPAIPEFEYFGMLAKLFSPAYPRDPTAPPMPELEPYLYEAPTP
jgi:hypothetical protein